MINYLSSQKTGMLFCVTVFILLCLGSVGVFTQFVVVIGTAFFIFSLGYKLIANKKIVMPVNFTYYVIFIFALGIHTFIFKGEFLFFWLFLSGGLIWLHVHNFKDLYSSFLNIFLILLGLMMGMLYFYSLSNPIVLPNLVSLFVGTTGLIKHSNIGDLWAVVLIPIIYGFIQKKSRIYIPLLLIGLYFLFISYSRAALVSLFVGIAYLFKSELLTKQNKKITYILFIVLALFFVYFGLTKTILFSRPYFLQAILGIVKYPLGTGVGNFEIISHSSNLVHNIFLEIFSGMGIFSVFFFVWIYKILKDFFAFQNTSKVAAAIFLAILTDFCFNTTYTIAGLVWIWFMSIGVKEPKYIN